MASPKTSRRSSWPNGLGSSPRRIAPATLRADGQSAFVQWPLLGLCAVLAVAAPLSLFLGVRGFAPVVGIGGLLCIPWARPMRRDWSGTLILAALVVWAGISVAWSPAPNLHALDSAKALSRFTVLHLALQLVLCTAFVTALARLSGAEAGKALSWIAFGFLAVLPLLIEEGLTHVRLYPVLVARAHLQPRPDRLVANMAQGGYVIAVMAWPLAVALRRQGRLRLALTLAAFVPLSMLLLRGVAPTVALALSLPAFLLVLRRGRIAVNILAGLTAAYMLTAPLIMLAVAHLGLYARFKADLPPSWSERLRIWSFVGDRISRTSLRGAGLDASRTFPGVVPLHPHNAPLQVWYELGVPGAVLATLFWLWLWWRIRDTARRDRLYGATAAAATTVYLTISAVSFGQWQEWWLCVGAFAMALCVLLGKTLAPDGPGSSTARGHQHRLHRRDPCEEPCMRVSPAHRAAETGGRADDHVPPWRPARGPGGGGRRQAQAERRQKPT